MAVLVAVATLKTTGLLAIARDMSFFVAVATDDLTRLRAVTSHVTLFAAVAAGAVTATALGTVAREVAH